MKLKGKVVLITGAGSGIGESTAHLFAREGAKVAVNDINAEQGQRTVTAIVESGGEAAFFQADVTAEAEVRYMVANVLGHFRQIDILFNNAGISCVGAIHELTEEQWDRVMKVNTKGVFLPSKYVIQHMMERRSGVIINMSSALAEIGLLRRVAYAASKGAVLAMTKSMQVDCAPFNIRVNALLPGTIYTPFVEKYLKDSYDDPEEGLRSIKNRQLSGELGKPEDVAAAALFLASDDAKFIMGSPLIIDGGTISGKNS